MNRAAARLLPPRLALVADDLLIHAYFRSRLDAAYELICFHDARSALAAFGQTHFDLCLVDIQIPDMDGLALIAAAALVDPTLGFVVLSAFDSEKNLRRTVPLQVYDFIWKPLPQRDGFEARLPEWIARTRQRRRDRALAEQAGTMDRDLYTARIERDIEWVASESARDALMEAANLLSTIHAHLVTATAQVSSRVKPEPVLLPLLRNLEVCRKTAEAAAALTEGFFSSAYGSRDASPALVHPGIEQAIGIASRITRAEAAGKVVDFSATDLRLHIQNLSGIDFLLMMVPVIGLALTVTAANTTVRINLESLSLLGTACGDLRFKNHLWLNRRNAHTSHPGTLITVTASGAPFTRVLSEAWLKGEEPAFSTVTVRSLLRGIEQCHGLVALALTPQADRFQIVLALPT
jgi:CheY-like chemotaxis protein